MIDPDQAIGASLNSHALPGYSWFFGVVTMLGEAYLWIIICAIAILVGRWRKVAATLIIVLLFSMVVNEDIKGIVHRGRPNGVVVPGYFSLQSYAFPSGHTQTAFAIAAFLTAFIERRYNLITFLLAAAVGMSRMYLGYHYFTDTVGGAAAGMTIGLLAIYGMYRLGLLHKGDQARPGPRSARAGSGRGTIHEKMVNYAVIIFAAGFLIALAARLLSWYLPSLAVVVITYIIVLLLPAIQSYTPSQAFYRPR